MTSNAQKTWEDVFGEEIPAHVVDVQPDFLTIEVEDATNPGASKTITVTPDGLMQFVRHGQYSGSVHYFCGAYMENRFAGDLAEMCTTWFLAANRDGLKQAAQLVGLELDESKV